MKHGSVLASFVLAVALVFGVMLLAGCRDTVFPDGDECVPECAGRECGGDGCGGSCGQCDAGAGERCEDGVCVVCVPDCTGRECGGDGCGGSCGECGAEELCQNGICEAAGDVVMPLAIGNRWVFSIDVMDGLFVASAAYEATGTEDVGGVTVTRIEGECTGSPIICGMMEGYYWLAANEEGGLYSYGDSRFGEYDPPNLQCRTDFNVGDTWQTIDDTTGNPVNWEVLSTSETVTVPAGIFTDCIHYTNGVDEERWYHIGAGNVKSISSAVVELTSYSYQ